MDPAPILARLRLIGPSSGPDLCRSLGISAATLSRAVTSARAQVLVLGSARRTRYAARRPIPEVDLPVPVFELRAGRAHRIGELHPVWPGFAFKGIAPLTGFYPGLPWFLNDLRPSGFLGRLVPRLHPELGLPADVLLWSANHTLAWLTRAGSDLPGNLILGEPALSAALDHEAEVIPSEDREKRYPILAGSISTHGIPGSSAAGEQPKFLTRVRGERGVVPVLVKFSPPLEGGALAQRAADLLRLEALALDTIAQAGIPASRAEIVEGGGRVFLQVERFDRPGPETRRGVVSFASLDDEFVGERRNWSSTAAALHGQSLLSSTSLARARWLDRFGASIANTDRHAGNLSCWFEQGEIGELCPAYDMLPMLYAPAHGELPARAFLAPTPNPADPAVTRNAWAAARRFWARAAELPELSAELRAIAADNEAALAAQARVIAALPAEQAAGSPTPRPRGPTAQPLGRPPPVSGRT